MSYEGYVQAICANGHYFTHDCYGEENCRICHARAVETHNVDETNGEPEPREVIEFEPALIFPLDAVLESLYEAKNLKQVAAIIAEIKENVIPRQLEPAKHRLGNVIPYKGPTDE